MFSEIIIYIIDNKEWLFSGLFLFIISLLVGLAKFLFFRKSNKTKTLNKEYLHEISTERFFDIKDEFQNFSELYIVGINLRRLVVGNIDLFKSKLKEGANIKILICDPKGDAIKFLADRSEAHKSEHAMISSIDRTIDNLRELSLMHCKGSIEVKTLDFVPSFSLILINPNQNNGVSRVSLYPYKTAPDSNPGFSLRESSDKNNYDFFKDQFNKLWSFANNI